MSIPENINYPLITPDMSVSVNIGITINSPLTHYPRAAANACPICYLYSPPYHCAFFNHRTARNTNTTSDNGVVFYASITLNSRVFFHYGITRNSCFPTNPKGAIIQIFRAHPSTKIAFSNTLIGNITNRPDAVQSTARFPNNLKTW